MLYAARTKPDCESTCIGKHLATLTRAHVPELLCEGEAPRVLPGHGGGGGRTEVQAGLATYQVQQEEPQGTKTHFKW